VTAPSRDELEGFVPILVLLLVISVPSLFLDSSQITATRIWQVRRVQGEMLVTMYLASSSVASCDILPPKDRNNYLLHDPPCSARSRRPVIVPELLERTKLLILDTSSA
jgi:hypothetical protein